MQKDKNHKNIVEYLSKHLESDMAIALAPGAMIPNLGKYCKGMVFRLENTSSEKSYIMDIYHAKQLIRNLEKIKQF